MPHDVIRRRGRPPTEYGKTLRRLGITRQQAHQWRRLAEIPEDVFEMLLRELDRPSTGALLREWDMKNQRHHRRLPASLERMAAELRRAGYTVFPPPTRDDE